MSEPAKAEKSAPPKAAAAKPKSTAPLPKQPGQSPATPTLAKLRRALGDLIVSYKTGRTHMFGIYAANLRSALDAAGKVRRVATDAERKDLDGLELRSRMLLIHVPGPDAKPTSDDGRLVIDWDYISDSIDQVVPGVGQVATKGPQHYRDCFEAVWRSTLYMKDAFREQWAEIQKHWFEFLYATATLVALETAALIASATPGTQLLGIVIQGLIIAFVAYAAVEIGIEAGQLTEGFWHSVKEANGDASKIDVAAEKFARLVIYILRLLAEAVAGGVLAKLSLNGMKRILGDQPVTPRLSATKGDELTSGPTSKPDEPASKTRDSLTSSKTKEATEPGRKKAEENRKPTSNVPAKVSNTSKPARSGTPDLPEYPVRLSDLKLEIKRSQFEWVIDIEAPLPNRGRVNIGIGSVELENGVPKGGPDFVIKKDAIVGGVLGKVQVYGPAGKLSLTDLVLDKTIEAFTKEFGHSPDRLPGSLAWDNKKNFQVEYARATRSGMSQGAAANTAIRNTSFGRSRAARGYDQFSVKMGRFKDVDLGGDLGTHHVPDTISVEARRSK